MPRHHLLHLPEAVQQWKVHMQKGKATMHRSVQMPGNAGGVS
jgi:hypothetical protein